jgi:ankyrin repeat protein
MIRAMLLLVLALLILPLRATAQTPSPYPISDYEVVRAHEIKPHSMRVPMNSVVDGNAGLTVGTNLSGVISVDLKLIISPTGDVLSATTQSTKGEIIDIVTLPKLDAIVRQWKYVPFMKDGKAVTAEITEGLAIEPAERLPIAHVPPPAIRPDSKVTITLRRTECFGFCPVYTVTIGTDGVVFDGQRYVVAPGKQFEAIDPNEVRKLAEKYVAADFFSMDNSYAGNMIDVPSCTISVEIDGEKKEVRDTLGSRSGMPEIILDLEDEVDAFARTDRWVVGGDGLVPALRAEGYNFQTFDAQIMLKRAAENSQAATVRELLQAGVPLQPLPAPPKQPGKDYVVFDLNHPMNRELPGWLAAAYKDPETLQVLIHAGASKDDQRDKDEALRNAAAAGQLDSVRALIAYGADPNFDPTQLVPTAADTPVGNALINAVASGNLDMVREILRYHPNVNARDAQGRTALFAVRDSLVTTNVSDRLECVRLLVAAGADVNARDNSGNTPLHFAKTAEMAEELLRLGADVNARNNVGETPIFTTLERAIPVLFQHGADPTVRNNKGQTALEKVPTTQLNVKLRLDALNKAIQDSAQH